MQRRESKKQLSDQDVSSLRTYAKRRVLIEMIENVRK